MLFSVLFLLACVTFVFSLPPLKARQQRAQVITRCTVPNTAALTFDDGPYQYIYDIASKLKAVNATATFFFNGNNYGCIYSNDSASRIKYVFDHGHQVASHTWSHKDLTKLSWDNVNNEMLKVNQAIQRITGALPSFMRPPYGNYNDRVLEIAASRKQSLVLWDFDSGDSVGVSVPNQMARYTQLAKSRPKTVLTLNHEVHESTANEVLPHAINQLRGAGYRLVTVAECLGMPAYQSRKAPSKRDSSWHC